MTNYQEARVHKLTNTQLSKWKSVLTSRTGTILILNRKNFEDEEVPHKLFLTARQTTKLEMPLLTICQQIENLVEYLK